MTEQKRPQQCEGCALAEHDAYICARWRLSYAVNEPKYRNTPTERVTASGAVLRFDSQKEARRYDHLTLRQQAGEIHDLRLQVDFTLQEAYTDQEGRRVRAIRYRADFTYRERDGRMVVEDVKSKPTRTREYLIKRKLMKERRGIDITEV